MITYILAILAAISALTILFVKEVFHAAMLLIVCLLCVAGIFVTFDAEFLAVVQLMVYAGGILVLIIFGIMITVRDKRDVKENKFIAGLIGLPLFFLMTYSIKELPEATTNINLSPETIGSLIITSYAVPFELAGVLLLVSLIAAIVAATNKDAS